jgi:hypothetical protein
MLVLSISCLVYLLYCAVVVQDLHCEMLMRRRVAATKHLIAGSLLYDGQTDGSGMEHPENDPFGVGHLEHVFITLSSSPS